MVFIYATISLSRRTFSDSLSFPHDISRKANIDKKKNLICFALIL